MAMVSSLPIDPLTLLYQIEQRSLHNAAGLPLHAEVKRPWTGMGFRLGEVRLVASIDEVHEILMYPVVSRIPGTRPWVKGIANVRSSLLSVMDLKGYLGKGETKLTPDSRTLVIRYADTYVGLLVDEVLGLKHFFEEEDWAQMLPQVDAALRNHLLGAFLKDGQYWGVFSLVTLVTSPEFMLVT
jgi:twitching motility protein PilI